MVMKLNLISEPTWMKSELKDHCVPFDRVQLLLLQDSVHCISVAVH